MKTLEVNARVFKEMVRFAQSSPISLVCNCKNIMASLLPNNEDANYIYGVSKPHYRIVVGVHESVAFWTKEDCFCFCLNCGQKIFKKIPWILEASDPEKPTKGGYFITISQLNKNCETVLFSRFQSELHTFRYTMQKLGFTKK